MTYRDALNALHAALPALKGTRSYDFACDLLLQAKNAQDGFAPPLSENQWRWVRKLAEQAAAPVHPAAVANFSGVAELFRNAREHLKSPKIRLALPDGSPIVLSVAGPASRQPGTINITDGRGFGANTWYGRIDPVTGAWAPAREVGAEMATSIAALLLGLSANPAGVAAAHGHATGNCCFCARDLTDPRSVSVGYGPICASRFSLPWGE